MSAADSPRVIPLTANPLSGRTFVANANVVEEDKRTRVVPCSMPDILGHVRQLTRAWPRRVDQSLFVPDGDGGIRWLESTAALFAWLGERTGQPVQWHRGVGCHAKDEAFAAFRGTAQAYLAVELLPHFPQLEDHFYAHSPVRPGNGRTLNALIDRFSPETATDRHLIKAAFCTPFWGGAGGSRPAFLWTAAGGRGKGKSTAAKYAGELAGGFLDVDQGEEMSTFKQRLLSIEGRGKRVARIDNVKSRQFGWGELEAMITAPRISGKQLYVGEAQRPNTITWHITLNGASLSTDMTQRCVEIRLGTPRYAGDWEDSLRAFVAANREALVADVAAFFAAAPHRLEQFTRWPDWERDVLARLPQPQEAQRLIAERQGEVDAEREESALLEEHFAKKLADAHYDVETGVVHIPVAVAAQWFNEALGERVKVTAASRALKQMADERRDLKIRPNPCRTYGRGFIWRGASAAIEQPTAYDFQERLESLQRLNHR